MRKSRGLKSYPDAATKCEQVVEHTLATPPELVARIAAIIGGQN